MNSWLDQVMAWGQAAIDEKPIVLDSHGGRAQYFVAVEESLHAKEHVQELTIKQTARDVSQRLIAVPLSGGMDSLFAYERAMEEFPATVRAFYVKLNSPYAEAELRALHTLKLDFEVLDYSHWPERWVPYKTAWRHILPLRNLAIILAIAEELDSPAEIWLGATHGEIPPVGGDKSMRFFDAVDTILDTYPIKHTLKFPLRSDTKTDLVHWWIESDRSREVLLRTVTCQALVDGQACGRCHACFNRWVALSNNGIQEVMLSDPASQLANAQKVVLMEEAQRQKDYSQWSEKRILQTLSAWYRVHQRQS